MTDRRPRRSRRSCIAVAVLGAAALAALPTATAVAPSAATPVAADDRGGSISALAGLPDALRAVADPPAAPAIAPPPVRFVPAALTVPLITTTEAPGTAAAAAIEFALAQRGLPYVWGGDGPQAGDAGFDCSGLTTAAYAYAGVDLPRTAHTQFYEGPHVPDDAPLEPGDLVFYGVPERVHHVGLYLGDGMMVNAPTFGKPVRLAYVRYDTDDYLGATRPAAGRDAREGLIATADLPVAVPPLPAPEAPTEPDEFEAPAVLDENGDGIPDDPPVPAESDGDPESDGDDAEEGDDAEDGDDQDDGGELPAPVGLTWLDDVEVRLERAELGDAGYPTAPATPDVGTLVWTEVDGGPNAAVALLPESGAALLEPDAVVRLLFADGTVVEYTVQERLSVEVDTAADFVRTRGDGGRLVILLRDLDTRDNLLALVALRVER